MPGGEPGPFSTDWAGRSPKQTPSTISDYASAKQTAAKGGTQAGDPARTAVAMITPSEMLNPPRQLVLGERGHDNVVAELKQRVAEIEGTRTLSVGADSTKGRRNRRCRFGVMVLRGLLHR